MRSSAFSSGCGERLTKCASALQYWQTIGVMYPDNGERVGDGWYGCGMTHSLADTGGSAIVIPSAIGLSVTDARKQCLGR